MYPIFKRVVNVPERIVMFTGLNIGITLTEVPEMQDRVGKLVTTWSPHTNKHWEDCEDPRLSRTNKMLKALRDE